MRKCTKNIYLCQTFLFQVLPVLSSFFCYKFHTVLFCRSGAFSHLKFVTTLALSHCDIETVEDGAFEGMEALSEVKLESNKLLYLQGTGLFPKHLNHIEVRKAFFSSTFTIGDSIILTLLRIFLHILQNYVGMNSKGEF